MALIAMLKQSDAKGRAVQCYLVWLTVVCAVLVHWQNACVMVSVFSQPLSELQKYYGKRGVFLGMIGAVAAVLLSFGLWRLGHPPLGR
jgi:hypothetical protein